MLRGLRAQRAVTGMIGRVAGGAVSKVIHVAGLPTRGDIRRLSRQVTVLTGEVRALKAAQATVEQTRPRGTRVAGAKRETGDSA
jgi:hypothetical protein